MRSYAPGKRGVQSYAPPHSRFAANLVQFCRKPHSSKWLVEVFAKSQRLQACESSLQQVAGQQRPRPPQAGKLTPASGWSKKYPRVSFCKLAGKLTPASGWLKSCPKVSACTLAGKPTPAGGWSKRCPRVSVCKLAGKFTPASGWPKGLQESTSAGLLESSLQQVAG